MSELEKQSKGSLEVPEFLQEAKRAKADKTGYRKSHTGRPIEWRRAKLEPYLKKLIALRQLFGGRRLLAEAIGIEQGSISHYLSTTKTGAWAMGQIPNLPTLAKIDALYAAEFEMESAEETLDPVTAERHELEVKTESGRLSEEEHKAMFDEDRPPAVPEVKKLGKDRIFNDDGELPPSEAEKTATLNQMNAFAIFQEPDSIEEHRIGTLEEITGLWIAKHPETGMLYLRGTSKTKDGWGRLKYTRFVIMPHTDRMSTYTKDDFPSYRLCREIAE